MAFPALAAGSRTCGSRCLSEDLDYRALSIVYGVESVPVALS